MLVLHGFPDSAPTRKVLWALYELGVEHRFVKVDLLKGEHLSDDFKRVNPNARVPAIEDEGFVLWESNAILEYLAERYRGLMPPDIRDRARVRQWLSWQASHFWMPLESAFLCKFLPALGVPYDTSRLTQYLEESAPHLELLDGHLKDRAYLAGNSLTIADVSIGITASLALHCGVDMKTYPALATYLDQIGERPPFQRCRLKTQV
jgi:glutathione S-transferase